jgi:hypothetical protein
MTAKRRKPSPTISAKSVTSTALVSGQEACALLGISFVTFKARLFRARRELLDQAQRALLVRIHKTTPSGVRILKNVDDPRVCGNLNP